MFVRYYYGETYSDDGPSYYLWATTDIYNDISLKSHFYLIFFIRILHEYFFLKYIHICLVFNIIGSIGFLFIVSVLQNVINRNYSHLERVMILFFILLPSLNFYTSAIGKDTIIITAASIFLYSILRINHRIILLIISVLTIFIIRPYIGFFIIVSLVIYYLLNLFKFNFIFNVISLTLLGLFIIVLQFTFLSEYAIDVFDINIIFSFIEYRQATHLEASTYTDISNMFFLFRPLNYIFRPFIFEINSLFIAIVAIENLFLMFLFSYYIFKIKIKKIFQNKVLLFIFIFSFVLLIFLSNVTAVLGIAVRQKWLILIFLFYLFIASSNNSKKISSIN
tara:strand:- start:578 stop:1585 length:1008 start_codon:yes stop_codon:yes gene_type:complete